MIPKISGSGKSFSGLSTYLTHDPNAKTDERVAWTHTLNLANDHIPSAVNEMYLTAENAELLKHQAGVRAGGRPTENPVKHVSLNWAPDDYPSREHMIATAQGYLQYMGWHEHQAILVAHDDKSYKHLHIMLNVVHPETGLHLDDSKEKRRSQEWALEYERSQERIHCEQRLKNEHEREVNMPRNMCMAFKANEQEFSQAENQLSANYPEIPENSRNADWKILREFQRDERDEFHARGKLAFSDLRNSIYREVREEFRERWAAYHEARRLDADPEFLKSLKAEIIAERDAVFEPKREAAFSELREARKLEYRELLDRHIEQRGDLRWHQETGLDTSDFFHNLRADREARLDMAASFREAAVEQTSHQPGANHHQPSLTPAHDLVAAAGKEVESGFACFGAGAASLADSLFFDLTTLGSAKPVPMSAEEKADLFREAGENALKQHQQRERDEEDVAWRERQKDLFGE